MVEAFKLITGRYDTSLESPLTLAPRGGRETRGNSMKLEKKKYKKALRKNFFTLRITNFWNELPNKVIEAPSVKSFERRLDKFWRKYKIRYDFEKCVLFEAQMKTGTGTINLIENIEEEDEEEDLEHRP